MSATGQSEPSVPIPFPDVDLERAIAAAAAAWEPLAARAFAEYRRRGRGVLTVESTSLDGPADAAAASATFIPATVVSKGDDFRGLLQQYDPHRQVPVLLGHASGAEAMIVLEMNGTSRPAPAECFARRENQSKPSTPAT